MLKKIKLRIKKSIWFYPALYTFYSLLLSIFIVMADSGIWISLDKSISKLFLTNIDLAQAILGIVAAALITITTFTFSTTMVVLTMYSSQFSPRTVENFLSDENTMKALGIFMGGFVYSVITLLFIRQDMVGQFVIAGTVAILYMLFCLVRFTMYIHHVGSYIQTNNLIERLESDADLRIEAYRRLLGKGTVIPFTYGYETPYLYNIKSSLSGYIQLVDYDTLSGIAEEKNGVIIFKKIIGQFVTDETVIFSIFFIKPTDFDDEFPARLRSCLTIDKEKTEMQDFNFSIQKIIEIALRAISPGINDPNTARHCLRITGVLLGKLADLSSGYLVFEKSDEKEGRLIIEVIDFKKELYFIFSQIIHYGRQDVTVLISFLKSLRFIAEKASNQNYLEILSFMDYAWEKIDVSKMTRMDREMLEHEKNKIKSLKIRG